MTIIYDDDSVLKLERTETGWKWMLRIPPLTELAGEATTFYDAREAARAARIADHVRKMGDVRKMGA